MAANVRRLAELGMVPELAKEVASQIDTAVSPGEITNAMVAADAAIALSKLATGALPAAITVASANLVDGTVVNADINAAAAIATTKLADGTPLAALVADATPLAALADVETELTALAESDLVTAVGAPAVYSEVPADLAAVLVAAGLMQAE